MLVRELLTEIVKTRASKNDAYLSREWGMFDAKHGKMEFNPEMLKYFDRTKKLGSYKGYTLELHYFSKKRNARAKIWAVVKDGSNVVGAVILEPFGKWNPETGFHASYSTSSIQLLEPYRGKGIPKALYKSLVDSGLILVSGDKQSPGGASIWKGLSKDKELKVQGFDPDERFNRWDKRNVISSKNKAKGIYTLKKRYHRLVAFK
jgi:hypothetical protein